MDKKEQLRISIVVDRNLYPELYDELAKMPESKKRMRATKIMTLAWKAVLDMRHGLKLAHAVVEVPVLAAVKEATPSTQEPVSEAPVVGLVMDDEEVGDLANIMNGGINFRT